MVIASNVPIKPNVGEDSSDNDNTSHVPKPITLVLLGYGLVGLAAIR
jgi:hypothetical protein